MLEIWQKPYYAYGGGVSFNTAGSLSTALQWKLSHRNFQFPRTLNNIIKVAFYDTFP